MSFQHPMMFGFLNSGQHERRKCFKDGMIYWGGLEEQGKERPREGGVGQYHSSSALNYRINWKRMLVLTKCG